MQRGRPLELMGCREMLRTREPEREKVSKAQFSHSIKEAGKKERFLNIKKYLLEEGETTLSTLSQLPARIYSCCFQISAQ